MYKYIYLNQYSHISIHIYFIFIKYITLHLYLHIYFNYYFIFKFSDAFLNVN